MLSPLLPPGVDDVKLFFFVIDKSGLYYKRIVITMTIVKVTPQFGASL
jgi:hypothetical protein